MKYQALLYSSLFLTSCHDNSICINLKESEIHSCNGSTLSRVMIEENKNANKSYYVELIRHDLGKDFFNVQHPDSNYVITELPFDTIKNSNFRLKPSTKYTITNLSNGDAAGCPVFIATDINGNIINASKQDCD